MDTITMRFSEIVEAQNMVKKSFPKINLPYFSDRNLTSNHSEKVIEQRKILIQDFFQTLLGSEGFFDQQDQCTIQKLQSVLKYIGLPINFYQLPELLSEMSSEDIESSVPSERTQSYSRKGSFNKGAISNSESLVQTLNQIDQINNSLADDHHMNPILNSLPNPDSLVSLQQQSRYAQVNIKSHSRQNSRERPISASKLLASKASLTQLSGSKSSEELIIIVKLSNQEIKVTLTDETRALNVYTMISQKIGLKQTYDFKLIDPKSDRIIQDDELVINLFRKRQAEGLRGITRDIQNKIKGFIQEQLFFKKILFLPREIEAQEFLSDTVRLDLIYHQILNDIMNLNKIQLNFKEYSWISALQIYKQSLVTKKMDISTDILKKYIPEIILKSTNKEIWNKELSLIFKKLEEMSKITSITQDSLQQDIIVKQVTVNLLLENKLYGMVIFEAENLNSNQFSMNVIIPQKILIGVNLEGIHILEPKKKSILTSILGGQIEKLNIQANTLQILVDDEISGMKQLKFNSNFTYQIYFLYEEYQEIISEIDIAYSNNQL